MTIVTVLAIMNVVAIKTVMYLSEINWVSNVGNLFQDNKKLQSSK